MGKRHGGPHGPTTPTAVYIYHLSICGYTLYILYILYIWSDSIYNVIPHMLFLYISIYIYYPYSLFIVDIRGSEMDLILFGGLHGKDAGAEGHAFGEAGGVF